RSLVPNPNAPAAGNWQEAAGPHGSKVQRWVANPETAGSGLWGGDVYGAGPSNIADLTGFPQKPVVPPLEKPEKPAKGGGRSRAAKAETDDSEAIALERLAN